MAILNFFIPPMSAELKQRTHEAYVISGIYHYMRQDYIPGKMPHSPLRLAYVLGLTTSQHGMSFFPRAATDYEPLSNIDARYLFSLAAKWWQGTMRDFNSCGCIELLLLPFGNYVRRSIIVNLNSYTAYSNMKTSTSVPPDVMARLETSLASLEAALLAKDPLLSQHLRNTHSVLISYPETVHLLDDSEIARIIDAAEVHTKTQVVKATVAGKGSKKQMTIADL